MSEIASQTLDLDALRDVLRSVPDPELGIDIVSLGVLRDIVRVGETLHVTLAPTSPACPVGPWMQDEARTVLEEVLPAGSVVEVSLVWDPPWSPDDMEDEARAALGYPH